MVDIAVELAGQRRCLHGAAEAGIAALVRRVLQKDRAGARLGQAAAGPVGLGTSPKQSSASMMSGSGE